MNEPVDEWADDLEELKNELRHSERHTVKLLFLSIPAILVYHMFFAACLALILNLAQVFVQTYSKKVNLGDLVSEISILMVVGPVYGIKWARKRCQTACRPMMSWKIIVPLSLLLTPLLLSMYDFLYVTGYLALHKKLSWSISWQTLLQQYISIHQIISLPAYFLKILREYYLAAAGLIGTLAINYYGGLKKDNWLKLFVDEI